MRTIVAVLFTWLSAGIAFGWQAAPTAEPSPNSKQSVVVEEATTSVLFEKDGTGSREVHARFRILSDAAVQQFGVLIFPYLAANEELQVKDVHVRKPDGTIVKTSSDDIQDLPAEVTRAAPLYSDLHEKHVPVKGLGVGDELEYDINAFIKSPQIPGHFALEYRRIEDAPVERETLTIKAPETTLVTVKNRDSRPMTKQEGQYTVYSWQWSRAEPLPEDQRSTADSSPIVQFTNFENWEEVAEWYWGLQKDRMAVTPNIRAKAAELTKGLTSDSDKLKAIYNYVALKIRYVGIDFGRGRYQPHGADDVISNQYGDCKDKHTLLAALLSAAGIKAYPVLISTQRKLDAGVPSVLQFDHVITAVKEGSAWTFLDTTPQVAPFGMLLNGLRGKLALLVSDGPPSRIITTPELPPFDAYDRFTLKAKLDSSGALNGEVVRELRGDSEVLLRLAFRNTPESNWQDLVQRISYISGFQGEVSKFEVSDPDTTDQPFRISYHYHRKDYGDWENHRIPAPMPWLAMPKRDDLKLKENRPLPLTAETADYRSTVELPDGFSGQPPVNVRVHNELADFESDFSIDKGVFTASRHLKFKVHEVPKNQDDVYEAVRKAILDDYGTMVYISSDVNMQAGKLPEVGSEEQKAAQLFWQAQAAGQRRDILGVRRLLKEVIKIDPKYPKAWLMLGSSYMMTGDPDQGLEDMRKEVSLHPGDLDSYRMLGFALMSVRRNHEAQQVWQDLLKRNPEDRDAAANLGNLLMLDKKYAEAFAQYQAAVKLNPDSAALYNGLGMAALHSGNLKAGLQALDKTVELDPELSNDVAYELAENKQNLDKALTYAKRAVAGEEKKSSAFKLDSLELANLKTVNRLSAYWDTLGWVYFQLGDMENARKFLEAGWKLSQNPVEGDHLGQVYERLQESSKAAEMYALTLAANEHMTETRERLTKLLGSKAKVEQEIASARDKISRLREVRIPRNSTQKGSAEFFVLLGRGPKVEGVKFISGDEHLKSFAQEVAAANFDTVLPDDSETKIVRRGILDCTSLGCDFVLLKPNDVHSVE